MDSSFSYPEGVSGVRLQTLRSRSAGMGVYVYRAGPWLIDSGFAGARRQLLAWPGLEGASTCFLTHHHEDHAGNVAALVERGIEVLAPPPVIEWLPETRKPLPLYRRWVWGSPRLGEVSAVTGPLEGDGWALEPIHTPGHAPDHYVLFEPRRGLLFSADLFIASRVPVAKLEEDLDLLLESLRRARDLQPRAMFCAHRGRVGEPAQALGEKISWTEGVIEQAVTLRDRGADVREIARRVLGRERAIRWASGGEMSRRNLVRIALAAGAGRRDAREEPRD